MSTLTYLYIDCREEEVFPPISHDHLSPSLESVAVDGVRSIEQVEEEVLQSAEEEGRISASKQLKCEMRNWREDSRQRMIGK